ncbi:MAG: hypothetical protein WC869_06250 [Phycisphaerae bacterium]|jgi:hypothetical protein
MDGLSRAHQEHVVELLQKSTVARDSLPYTDEFQQLKTEFFDRTFKNVTDAEFWNILVTVGKKGGVRGKPRTSIAPSLAEDNQRLLLSLMPVPIGERDRLPYSKALDRLVQQFSSTAGTNLTHREIWLAILSLAK